MKISLFNPKWRYVDKCYIAGDLTANHLGDIKGLKREEILDYLLFHQIDHFGLIMVQSSKVICITDGVCSYPIIFNTELQLISDAIGCLKQRISLNIEVDSLLCLKHSGYTLGEETLFKNWSWMSPFGFFSFNNGNVKREYYLEATLIGEEENIYTDNLSRSLRKIETKIVLPLSAGADSRAILATALNEDKKIEIFTYGFLGNWDSDGAKKIAKAINKSIIQYHYSFKCHRKFWQSNELKNVENLQNAGVAIPFYQDTIYINKLLADIDGDFDVVNGNTGDFICGKHQAGTPAFYSQNDLVDYIIVAYFHLWKDIPAADNIVLKEKISAEINRVKKKYNVTEYTDILYYFEWENRQAKYLISGQRAYDQKNLNWRLPFWSIHMCASHLPGSNLKRIGVSEYESQLRRKYPKLFNNSNLGIKRFQGPFIARAFRFFFKKIFKYNEQILMRELNIFQPFMSILKMSACQPYFKQAFVIAPYNVETALVAHYFLADLTGVSEN